mgnify:CR=1 FL=1
MSFFSRAIGAVSIIACTLGAGAALAQTEVKIGYALAVDSHYGAGAKAWADAVEKASNGKYKFRHFPSSALGGEREVVEGVQLGTVEATIVSTGTLSNFVPAVGVVDIPFLFRDLGHARRVLDGPVGQQMLAQFTPRGLVALAWGEQGFRHITNNKHAISQPADLKGLKLRTMENPVHITAFRTLGAAPTPMSWPEVTGALQQGTIDGQENPLSVIVSAHLANVQKYLTLSGHVYAPAVVLVSPRFWNKLSDEDKAIFTEGAKAAVQAMRGYVDQVEEQGVARLRAAGMQVGTLSGPEKQAFLQALQPAYEQYYKQYDKALVDAIVNTQ